MLKYYSLVFIGFGLVSSIAAPVTAQQMPRLNTRPITAPINAGIVGYVKIDGIDGESINLGHKNWIEILSFSSRIRQPNNANQAGGRTGGRAIFSDIMITKRVDKASPDLFIHVANGKHIPKIEIEFNQNGREYNIELENTSIKSVKVEAGDGKTWPIEKVYISYAKIKIDYKPNANAASIDRTWDTERNTQR